MDLRKGRERKEKGKGGKRRIGRQRMMKIMINLHKRQKIREKKE